MSTKKKVNRRIEEYGLDSHPDDKLVSSLVQVIRFSVRALAILMTLLIFLGVIDVAWQIYKRLVEEPYGILTMHDLLSVFGAFLVVLIAIEIFANITMYLRDDIIHLKLVLATALMAVCRKVIIFDFTKHNPAYVAAIGLVIIGLSIGFWLVCHSSSKDLETLEDD